MTVLRSREVLPKKPVNDRSNIEPATPTQTRESTALHVENSLPVLRRSGRLSSKSSASNKSRLVSGQNVTERKRKLDVSDGSLILGSGQKEAVLGLRSGKRVARRVVENGGHELVKSLRGNGGDSDEKGKSSPRDDTQSGKEGVSGNGRRRFGIEEKGKDKIVDEGMSGDNESEKCKSRFTKEQKGKEKIVDEGMSGDYESAKRRRRFSREEKGKEKLVVEDYIELNLENEIKSSVEIRDSGVKPMGAKGSRMEQFRDIARQNASRFAHFSSNDEEDDLDPVERSDEIEDWPGPFSTAMKIMRDRADQTILKKDTDSLECKKKIPIVWVPKMGCKNGKKLLIPSLKELCIKILSKNADAITSLENVPDALRHHLSHMLCDSRGMNSHFVDLLVRGSPTEIRLRDCSWMTEEEFTKCFEGCDTSNLAVLQLDRCGRCMPDYIILSTLARSSNSLPALTSLSVIGACRLSDVGLQALVSAAPALRSLNLTQCSLLTSNSMNIIAESLGPVLQELYINDCQGLDAINILPAMKKLKHLEVLSLVGIGTVGNGFVRDFFSECGHKIKELVLTDCVKLTDVSLKVIAEACPGLCVLDISNLCKLTDFGIGYLANGCRAIQTLKLCRNAFSDEAIAAFLETSGESLKELSLNNVKKVANCTALSLAKRSRNLVSLDLSWCRNLKDEAVGLIVDSCLSLKLLKLFGCTQITNVFLDGHSNPEVEIVGLKMSPVLKHLTLPDPQEGPLHYSSILSSM